MQKSERWVGGSGNPSARLRAARSMPQWMETRTGLPTPPPPPPPDPEPPLNDPDYEVIDVPGQAYSNTLPTSIEVRVKRCELCGASGPSVLCQQCPQQSFCPSCDEMYHRHPKRQSHMRRAIMDPSRSAEAPRPPLPPKGDSQASHAPVPPPRRNKKNLLPPQGSSSTLKRETGIVGSIKRIITGGKAAPPPRPPPLSRDRSASLMNNNMDFSRGQMMMMGGELDANSWGRGGRVGSMTALNMAPGFGPMMHAQSMAHLGCPSCWGWGSQAALHQAGMHGPHSPHPMQGGMMPPPQPFWYPSWDPRRQRRHHHGRPPVDSSSDEDEHPSPALSRRSIRALDSDSDESFKKSRPQSRRESLADLRRRDDDTMSLRGGRYDEEVRSLRGQRRDSLRRREDALDRDGRRNRRFDDTVSERGGVTRRVEDTVSERGGSRRRQEDLLIDDRRRRGEEDTLSERGGARRRQEDLLTEDRRRRREEDTFSERGGRRLSETKYRDDDSWDRNSRKSDKSDKKYHREHSWDKQVDKKKERYVADSDSDKMPKPVVERKQDRLQEPLRTRDERKSGPSSTKSTETISSLVSTTSGEDKAKVSKKDRVFSDTGQRRRTTLESNAVQTQPKEEIVEIKEPEPTKEPEEEIIPLGAIPTSEWECRHCTYVNPAGVRVCEICCKTRTLDSDSTFLDQEETVETVEAEVETEPEEKVEIKIEEPKVQEQPKKKEVVVEATNGPQIVKNVSLSSKGTSPPPQSISTQTYDVAGLGVKKTSPEIGWTSPRRSFSRQSILSDTAQSGISPPRSRSPGETDSQLTDTRQPRRTELSSTLTRKASRAGSVVNEQTTMVQKQVNQGLEMVKLLREAEEVGFSGEEVSVAVEHCGDGSPLQWLLENWTHMIDTVVTLATNYGHERKENTIGTVSEREARGALITHQGSVWSAVTEVVQQRQNKYGELLSRGNFSREDIVTALTAHHGDLEAAYTELTKGEHEELKVELDPSGRVQSWLTQHVYQSLPKLKQTLTRQQSQTSRRHSDVHRFLDEVLSAQASPPIFGDNRYGSLHSLATKTARLQTNGDFGAPPERYMSLLNLHEASTRMDMTTPRLYAKQQPLIRTSDFSRSRGIERRISVPDHLQEFKEKFLFDRQVSSPDDFGMFERLEQSNRQPGKWTNTDTTTDLSSIIRSDSQTDGRSEYYEDSKSEEVVKDEEDEGEEAKEALDQVYNGRLQLLLQRNHRRKRRSKRAVKNYQSKIYVKSDVKHEVKKIREETVNADQAIEVKEDGKTEAKAVSAIGRPKKDSTDEYESIESSEEESSTNPTLAQDNTILRKPAVKNERIIIIDREPSDNEENQSALLNNLTTVNKKEMLSDKESIEKSHSDEILESDFKDMEGSFSNSIPFIDDDEVFSDASEEVVVKPQVKRVGNNQVKSKGGSRSDDSSRYLSPNEFSESEKAGTSSTDVKNVKNLERQKNRREEQLENSNVKESLITNQSLRQDEININSITGTVTSGGLIKGDNTQQEDDYEDEVSEEEEFEYVEVEQSLDDSSNNKIIKTKQIISGVNEKDINKIQEEDEGTSDESVEIELNQDVTENSTKRVAFQEQQMAPVTQVLNDSSTLSINNNEKNTQSEEIKLSEGHQELITELKSQDKTEKVHTASNEQPSNINGTEIADTRIELTDVEQFTEKLEQLETTPQKNKNAKQNQKSIGVKEKKNNKNKSGAGSIKPKAVINSKNNNGTKENNELLKQEGILEVRSAPDTSTKVKQNEVAPPKLVLTGMDMNNKVILPEVFQPAEDTQNGVHPPEVATAKEPHVGLDLPSVVQTSEETQNGEGLHEVVQTTEETHVVRDLPAAVQTTEETQNGVGLPKVIQTAEGSQNGEGLHEIIQTAEEMEKGVSDEKSNEKVDLNQVNTEDGSSEDNSRLTAFASGNLKTKIKVESNRLSPVVDIDESSDKDVSPIPTDSEGDKSRSPTKSKGDIEKLTAKNKREEMVTLIKESLSKDVVLDRLVGTILGVLQGGGTSNLLKDQDLAVLLSGETKSITEVPVAVGDEGMVSAIQLVQDINVNPKEAIQQTILQCDTIKRTSEVIKDDVQIKNEEFQREVRKVLAEGLVTSYPQAELVVNLMGLKFPADEAVQAATECTSIASAISFLQQECPLCANKCTIKQMVGMLECDHRCCKECAFNYFNLQVTEASVWDCVCPFCRLPNLKLATQDQAQLYFSHLDILLKGILPEATHELFQRKLRDWTLAQDPNFKWCTKCSSGFIANPDQKVLMCPDCRSITCARCRKPWEGGHEETCEELAEQVEPENLLNRHLEEEGITCPSCRARYSLARGGCMHMTCTSCKHEFCSGCSKPFLMGDRCHVSEYCPKLGLHAHHPRNCLFYLRDKEPQLLEQLLKEHNVDFNRDETDEGLTGRCKVNLIRETDDGLIETECSHPVHAQALCRTHYVEHLVRLVKVRKLDPATVMDLTEAQQELRRRGKKLPDRLPRQCDQSYLLSLIKIVQEEIPLE